MEIYLVSQASLMYLKLFVWKKTRILSCFVLLSLCPNSNGAGKRLCDCITLCYPDSKVHGANIGPTWVLSDPDVPHVGPMNLAIRVPNELTFSFADSTATNQSEVLLENVCQTTWFLCVFQKWHDEYLRWDPEEYHGVHTVRLDSNLLWKPDVMLYNSWVIRFAT